VIALGGNALLRRGQPLEADLQWQNVKVAASAIAELIREGHEVIICHGNGPQVGLLALQSEAYEEVRSYPLDVLDAESQSMIGYMLQQSLHNELPDKEVVTIVTQVEVNSSDPAFQKPTKFIGPIYSKDQAERLALEYGWTVKVDLDSVRRVVPSPHPKSIIEIDTITTLLDAGIITICGGGGGIPVIKNNGKLSGIEGVIDKDRTAALIAEQIQADALIILTDVDGIYEDYRNPKQQQIKQASVVALEATEFPAGSMGPKVEAACLFVSNTGGISAIGSLSNLLGIVNKESGTHITSNAQETTYYS
jgi:carbamate kinase